MNNLLGEYSIASLLHDLLFISTGIIYTLKLSIFSLILGFFLALLCLPLRQTFFLGFLLKRLISLIRGTPLILQLCILYYCGIISDILWSGIVTFGLNSFAYISEILRSGISSIPKGQFEASKALQIPKLYMWKNIIFPQILKNTFPALINESATILKESALISIIGGADIMKYAQIIGSQKFIFFTPLLIAGLYYYIIILLIEFTGEKFYKIINAQS